MYKVLVSIAVLAMATTAIGQTTLLIEDFEDIVVEYTTSTPEFSDGAGDFWFNTSGPLTHGTFVEYFGADGGIFNGMDLDGEGATLPLVMDFSGIDIAGFTGLVFGIDLAEDDDGTNEDWDLPDYVHVDYQIDGGGYQNLLWVESIPNETIYNAVPGIDVDFDGTGDGPAITSTFAPFSAAIGGTGSTLDLRITWQLDSGDEDLAIDNVQITGVPEPASLLLLGLGFLAIRRR